MPSSPQVLAPRVLVIGLDVGDGALVRAWAEAGELPALAGLLETGAWADLSTPAETLHVSAWPSLYTGTRPGQHGVYYTFQPAPGEQGARRFGADQYGRPPLWQVASAAGKRCAVLDAPYTHPVEPFDGEQVFEWGTWAHYWTPGSRPEELYKRLVRERGAYPLGVEANRIGLVALEPVGLARDLERAAAAKAEAAAWMMERGAELFVVVFGETHPAAHYCWPAGLGVDALESEPERFRGVLDVYRAVDAGIAKLLARVDAEATVMVVSGDGVGPNRAGWHLLPEVLRRLGFSVPPGAPAGGSGPEEDASEGTANGSPARTRRGLFQTLRDLIPNDLRQSVSRHLPASVRDRLMKKKAAESLDWSRTRAYCLPTDFEGCLRVNLRGREPEGIVAPGAEYEAVCSELTAGLVALVNPRTGRPAVRRVVRVHDELPGARADRLPDLVVLWAEEAEIDALESPAVGTVSGPSPDGRTGTHDPRGFLIARGPGIAAGSRLAGLDVVDFAPTVLARLGVDVPEHMEGRVFAALTPAPQRSGGERA